MKQTKLLALSSVFSAALFGCNLGGSGSTRGATTVSLSGTVEIPVSASVSSPLPGLIVAGGGKSKFVEEAASAGTVTIMNSEGQTLDVVAVQGDGTYATSLPADDVQGETIFIVYENELDKSEPPIHSYESVSTTATAATVHVNTETDFSTAVLLAVAEHETGEEFKVGEDMTAALAVVEPEAIRESIEAVIGDTAITGNTSVDTADVGIEAAYEAHQAYIVEGGSPSVSGGEPTPPVEVLAEAIQGDAASIGSIAAEVPTAGGGIPIDATVYDAALQTSNTIFESYANKADAAVIADWETIKASLGTMDMRAYIGPIVEVKPADLRDGVIKPNDLRNCARQIAEMDPAIARVFGQDSKARAAIIEGLRIGAYDHPDEAKFVMGALGGSIPAATVSGATYSYDLSNFVPETVAQASHVVGLDLKNKIDPSQYATYTVDHLATSFAPQMRDTDVIQTCALTGIAGCSGLVLAIINNDPGTVLDSRHVTIAKPPGAICTVGGCASGGNCTAQTDGSMKCAALSGKLGLACTTSSDCDDVTFCSLSGNCVLTAGATTGMGSITAGGTPVVFGGSETGAPVVTSTGTAGGLCSAGSCLTGSTCQSGICVASTTTILSGAGSSCLTSATCHTGLTCSGGICTGSDSGGGGLSATGGACTTNAFCGSGCCHMGLCSTASTCTGGTTTTTTTGGTTTTTTTTTTGGTTTTTTGCTTACTAGSACSSDSTCSSGYCGNRSFSTSPGTCAGTGTGAAGQYCLVSSNCATGLTCSGGHSCVAQSQPSCTANGNSCTTGASCCSTYCGGFSNSRQCKAMGSGGPSEHCDLPGHCMAGYTCNIAMMSCMIGGM